MKEQEPTPVDTSTEEESDTKKKQRLSEAAKHAVEGNKFQDKIDQNEMEIAGGEDNEDEPPAVRNLTASMMKTERKPKKISEPAKPKEDKLEDHPEFV